VGEILLFNRFFRLSIRALIQSRHVSTIAKI